jgi:hypothetical protein
MAAKPQISAPKFVIYFVTQTSRVIYQLLNLFQFDILEEKNQGNYVSVKAIGWGSAIPQLQSSCKKEGVAIASWNEEFSHYEIIEGDIYEESGPVHDVIVKYRARAGLNPEVPTASSFVERFD